MTVYIKSVQGKKAAGAPTQCGVDQEIDGVESCVLERQEALNCMFKMGKHDCHDSEGTLEYRLIKLHPSHPDEGNSLEEPRQSLRKSTYQAFDYKQIHVFYE